MSIIKRDDPLGLRRVDTLMDRRDVRFAVCISYGLDCTAHAVDAD